jgi:hypothetical protein
MSQEMIEGKIRGIKVIERLVKVSGLFRKVHDASESKLHTIIYQGYIAGVAYERKVKFIYDERVDYASAEFSNNSHETLAVDMKQEMAKYQTEEVRGSIKEITQ